MAARSALAIVEFFHLLLLRHLAKGADRDRITLKGGCNLRFFFQSIRYSEDVDLDVSTLARDTLKNKVDRLLGSPALTLPLQGQGMALVDISAVKQTDTTQRWKLGITAPGHASPLRTKIEFSRRSADPEESVVEPVDGALARSHGLVSPVVRHYTVTAALQQKVHALAGRAEAQVRDVFDIQLLRSKSPELPNLSASLRAMLPEALNRVSGLSYEDYVSQVVAYIAPEHAAAYRDRAVWDAMQLEVIQLLEELSV